MTCVITLKTKKEIFLACDSVCSTEDGDTRARQDLKILCNNGILIGASGDPRAFQCLKPEIWSPNETNIYRLVKELREVLTENGCMISNPEVGEIVGTVFLIVLNNEVYEIQPNFQVAHFRDEYTSIGSGAPYALGSLYETSGKKMSYQTRILKALYAAEYFNRGVGRPFYIVSNKREDMEIFE